MIFSPVFLFCQIQNNDPEAAESKHKIRIGMLVPGVSVETALREKITLFTEVGTGFSLIIKDHGNMFFVNIMNSPEDEYISGTYFRFFPFAKLEERFYYNTHKRKAVGKSIQNFSGNYISNYNVYLFNEKFTTGFTWGMQRNSRKFFFNLNLGLGISFDKKEISPAVITEVKLGFLLN
jgi:hypothetical protein